MARPDSSGAGLFYWRGDEPQGEEKAHEAKVRVVVPTGPDCSMTWEQCLAWARQQDGIDDPEGYCAAKEQD